VSAEATLVAECSRSRLRRRLHDNDAAHVPVLPIATPGAFLATLLSYSRAVCRPVASRQPGPASSSVIDLVCVAISAASRRPMPRQTAAALVGACRSLHGMAGALETSDGRARLSKIVDEQLLSEMRDFLKHSHLSD